MPSGFRLFSGLTFIAHIVCVLLSHRHALSRSSFPSHIVSHRSFSRLITPSLILTPRFLFSIRIKWASGLYIQITTNQSYCTAKDMRTHFTDRQNVSQLTRWKHTKKDVGMRTRCPQCWICDKTWFEKNSCPMKETGFWHTMALN